MTILQLRSSWPAFGGGVLAELELNIYKHLGAADFEACAGVGWIDFHAVEMV